MHHFRIISPECLPRTLLTTSQEQITAMTPAQASRRDFAAGAFYWDGDQTLLALNAPSAENPRSITMAIG